MFTIYCIIHDTGTPFPVKMPEDATVGELKQEIKATDEASAAGIDHALLDLYRIDVAADEDSEEVYIQEVQRKAQDLSALTKLDPMLPLNEVYDKGLPADMIHVLVVPRQNSPKPLSNLPWSCFERLPSLTSLAHQSTTL